MSYFKNLCLEQCPKLRNYNLLPGSQYTKESFKSVNNSWHIKIKFFLGISCRTGKVIDEKPETKYLVALSFENYL
jgi:hypothetical protein